MDYNPVKTVLVEMIASKNNTVSILKDDKQYIVIDLKGWHDAQGFKTLQCAKDYVYSAYGLKASK